MRSEKDIVTLRAQFDGLEAMCRDFVDNNIDASWIFMNEWGIKAKEADPLMAMLYTSAIIGMGRFIVEAEAKRRDKKKNGT